MQSMSQLSLKYTVVVFFFKLPVVVDAVICHPGNS